MQNKGFDLIRDLYEQAITREENRKNTYEQKASNLIGFLGATVGVFIGTLIPVMLSEDFLEKVFACKLITTLWVISMISFAAGLIFFIIMVWVWKNMLSPASYMYPDPLSLHDLNEVDAKKEYLNDLKNSAKFNQARVNSLGTQFIKMTVLIKSITLSFLLSVCFLVACKLLIS